MKKNNIIISGFAKIVANDNLDILMANKEFYKILKCDKEQTLLKDKGLTMFICDELNMDIKKRMLDIKEKSFVLEDVSKNICMQFEYTDEKTSLNEDIYIVMVNNNIDHNDDEIVNIRELKQLQNSIPGYFGKVAVLEDYLYVLSGNDQFYDVMKVDKNVHKYEVYYENIGVDRDIVDDVVDNKKESFLFEYEHGEYETMRNFVVTGTRYDNEIYDNKYPVFFIVAMDITAQKESKAQAFLQQEKYKIISDMSQDVIFEYDCFLDFLEYSENYKQIFGRNTIINNLKIDMVNGVNNPNNIKINFIDMFEAIESGETRFEMECSLRVKDETYKWFSVNATGMKNKDGDLIKIIGVLRDIDKQKKEQKKLFDKSRIDSMTGLLNKVATEEEITNKLFELQEDSYGVLIMIDIDKFKEINDTFGHMTGDLVIKKIAANLKSIFRSEDIIGRIGGDEFQVYMSNVLDKNIVNEKAEYLNNYIRTMFIGTEIDEMISVSIGVAYTDTREIVYKELYQKADIALYNAKENGRDRFEIYGKVSNKNDNVMVKHVPSRDLTGFNYNAILHIIELLFNNGKKENSINTLLEYINYMISIDRVVIYKKCDKKDVMIIDYEWHNKTKQEHYLYNPKQEIKDYVVLQKDIASDIQYCSDISELSEKERVYYAQREAVSLFQYCIMSEKKVIGYMEFIKEKEKKVWTQQELGLLQIVAKLMSEFLFKSENKITINCEKKENMEQKFAMALKDRCVQLIDLDINIGSFDLYIPCNDGFSDYINRSNYDDWLVEKVIPYISQEYCEQYLDSFLLRSMMRRFATGSKKIVMEYRKNNEDIEKWYRETAMLVQDEKGRKSIVSYVVDISSKKVVQEEIEFMNWQLLHQTFALQHVCEEILEIDVVKKCAKIIFKRNNPLSSEVHVNGDIFENLRNYKEKYVEKKDRKKFGEYFNAENMCNYLKIDEGTCTFSYKKMINNMHEDMEVFISKVPKDNDQRVVVIFRKV